MEKQKNNVVLIKSYYSDDDTSFDGIYRVEIPQEHISHYKEVISEVGNVIDDIKNGFLHKVSDIDEQDIVLTINDYEKMWTKLLKAANDGTFLGNILNALQWNYEKMTYDSFDADYNVFD